MTDKKLPPSVAEFAFEERERLLATIAEQAELIRLQSARIEELEVESGTLREIIARAAEACGGYMDNACSLEFMALLPEEIRLKLVAPKQSGAVEVERLRAQMSERDALLARLRRVMKGMNDNIRANDEYGDAADACDDVEDTLKDIDALLFASAEPADGEVQS